MQIQSMTPIREVTAATAGAALGQIINAGLVDALHQTWWPGAACIIVCTFLGGWFSHRPAIDEQAG